MVYHAIFDELADLLASVGPHKVLAFRTIKKHQDRLGELLERNKLRQGLSKTEVSEMEQLMLLEHIISLAKARALEKLGKKPC